VRCGLCWLSCRPATLVGLLGLLAILATVATAAAAEQPRPLSGMRLTGATHLRLLVANDPPFVLDVDSGRVVPVSGLNVRGQPVLSVLPVGDDAVIWLDRPTYAKRPPSAELYLVRHNQTRATRFASGWDVAPAADGRSVWIKSYLTSRRCLLRRVGLDGGVRARRALACSTRLASVSGAAALLGRKGSLVDPRTGAALPTANALAIAGGFALGSAGSQMALTLTDLRSGKQRRLPWPSQINFTDAAAVSPNGRQIAVGFADPPTRELEHRSSTSGYSTREQVTSATSPTCRPTSRSNSPACSGHQTDDWSGSPRPPTTTSSPSGDPASNESPSAACSYPPETAAATPSSPGTTVAPAERRTIRNRISSDAVAVHGWIFP
jgi:hypothetical protein